MAGHFYSLVQSPQQFKQMLMAGAIDRYFQIARCYRDETTTPNRQPEFTQLDIELSFTSSDGVMQLTENILEQCWPAQAGTIDFPFPRMTFDDAMNKYGSDKPDTRYDCLLVRLRNPLKRSISLNKNISLSVGQCDRCFC